MAGKHFTSRTFSGANKLADDILAIKPEADVYINFVEAPADANWNSYYSINVVVKANAPANSTANVPQVA